ncbi:unnamed protein product [Acanthosepion pharaonis]|uniref:Uncharacterized protein n=1 Tax=Acanthosepion pharaonis TaxID=158019 RepID=A0A812B6K9_ACAPH|nr:unnamed protein product [Sepia pharaonis]
MRITGVRLRQTKASYFSFHGTLRTWCLVRRSAGVRLRQTEGRRRIDATYRTAAGVPAVAVSCCAVVVVVVVARHFLSAAPPGRPSGRSLFQSLADECGSCTTHVRLRQTKAFDELRHLTILRDLRTCIVMRITGVRLRQTKASYFSFHGTLRTWCLVRRSAGVRLRQTEGRRRIDATYRTAAGVPAVAVSCCAVVVVVVVARHFLSAAPPGRPSRLSLSVFSRRMRNFADRCRGGRRASGYGKRRPPFEELRTYLLRRITGSGYGKRRPPTHFGTSSG